MLDVYDLSEFISLIAIFSFVPWFCVSLVKLQSYSFILSILCRVTMLSTALFVLRRVAIPFLCIVVLLQLVWLLFYQFILDCFNWFGPGFVVLSSIVLIGTVIAIILFLSFQLVRPLFRRMVFDCFSVWLLFCQFVSNCSQFSLFVWLCHSVVLCLVLTLVANYFCSDVVSLLVFDCLNRIFLVLLSVCCLFVILSW